MSRILVVDDDALVLAVYGRKLNQEGFTVETVSDGFVAVRSLRSLPPDLVVLDLMMPKFSGVDVLKFIRGSAQLKDTPVLLLTNCFMGEMLEEATRLGVQGSLLKARCNPGELLEMVGKTLNTKATPASPAAPAEDAAHRAWQEFLERAPQAVGQMRTLCQAFVRAHDEAARQSRLEEFYKQTRQFTSLAGLADQPSMTLLASAFEALLHELLAKPAAISPSVLRTITSAMDLLAVRCARIRDTGRDAEIVAKILVVDDDPISNRIVAEALNRSRLPCTTTQDAVLAAKWLKETPYNLVLLDIEMPGLDGLELCKQLRKIPEHIHTPVIFVTSHADFEFRAKGILAGGDDVISKPIFPMELTLKAVTHLLRRRMDSKPPVK
ncbi:MAG: response regulator [Verrucomicrobia bacterium]|nr:MAG: response regulator [Verrucomicrobiota bacterium]